MRMNGYANEYLVWFFSATPRIVIIGTLSLHYHLLFRFMFYVPPLGEMLHISVVVLFSHSLAPGGVGPHPFRYAFYMFIISYFRFGAAGREGRSLQYLVFILW